MFSDRCKYLHNRFKQNGAGVAVMYTENVQMTDNVFEDNWGGSSYGLLLKDISDSRIASNMLSASDELAPSVARPTLMPRSSMGRIWAMPEPRR